MNVNGMRAIDRRVGAPLCFLLTLVERLLSWVRRPPAQAPIRRALFIQLAETGALVIAFPALREARRLHPGLDAYFLSFTEGGPVLDVLGIDRSRQILIRSGSVFTLVADTLAALRRLRRERIDATINLEAFARLSTILAYLTGAPRRVGFHRFFDEGRYTGHLVTHRVIYNPHLHAARSSIALVLALGESPDAEPRAKVQLDQVPLDLPRFPNSPTDRAAIAEKIRGQDPRFCAQDRLVLLNPNASDLVPVRRWPAEHFRALGEALLAEPDVVVAVTGSPGERARAEELCRSLAPRRVVNLAGLTTIRELLHLYGVADLMVTNDSGPAHMAALTDLPVLVLFGPETPRIYGPLGAGARVLYRGLACSPCVSVYNQKRSPCTDNQCLKTITPDEALAAARAILEERKPGRAPSPELRS